MPLIRVGEKALAHLSRGLYRSPASAVRELVSNAWDANATRVDINLNYPNFHQISITDNGDGFPKDEFERLMTKGIGSSLKRSDDRVLDFGRPIIGRLGIGLLGIAQICGAFKIVSQPKKGKPFQAKVVLYDLLRERLDQDDPQLVKATEVDVGEYSFEEVSIKFEGHGTKIIAVDVHPTFTRSFQQSTKFENFIPPSKNWAQVIESVEKVHSLNELGDYWRLLWELAASCPIPYVDAKALPNSLIKKKQEILESYNFSVVVDGIVIKKPIYLRDNPGGYTSRKIETQTKKIFGADVIFDGYLCVQEGAQLKPDESRGILLRISNVGIGYYDPTFLDYRYNQGPRSRWVTGEIYISTGVQAALNIDRDSFNKFHPEYRYIQEFIHRLLKEEIFPEVYRNLKERSKAKAHAKQSHRAKALATTIETFTGLKSVTKKSTLASVEKVNSETVAVKVPEAEDLGVKKANSHLAASILTLFEVANEKKNADERRDSFKALIVDFFNKW